MNSTISDISDILTGHRVSPSLKATSKKQLLQELASKAADANEVKQESRDIFEKLLQRERLGSTAVGSGVAVPHARIAGLKNIFGYFARLAEPVEFEAPDNQGVDLVFLLLAPEEAGADHLKALARVSRLLREEDVRNGLRGAKDPAALYAILTRTAAPEKRD